MPSAVGIEDVRERSSCQQSRRPRRGATMLGAHVRPVVWSRARLRAKAHSAIPLRPSVRATGGCWSWTR